jgi:hypothetical protein
MHRVTIPTNEKAAGRAATAATDTIQQKAYQPPTVPSSEISPADGSELGLLLLTLQRPGLSWFVRRHGYGLAEAWASQFVAARHPEVMP